MTLPARSSPKDYILDAIFGPRLEGKALERFRAEQPPKWIRTAISLSFLLWLGVLAYWWIGKLGWLPAQFVDPPAQSVIGTGGVVWTFAQLGISEYFRRRTARASRDAE